MTIKATALTMFPDSFAVKATYVAIHDSFGRAIDRYKYGKRMKMGLLEMGSHNAHTGNCFGCAGEFADRIVVEGHEMFVIPVQCVHIKLVGLGRDMLQKVGGIEVTLDFSTVRHDIPPLG